jgi:K+-transporting ATPase KdpF subunit
MTQLSGSWLTARIMLEGRGYDGHHFYRGHMRLLCNCNRLRMGVYSLMTPWELILGSVMAVGLTVYLVYAMLRPEKF